MAAERMVYAGSDFDPNPANGYRYLPRAGDRDARDSGSGAWPCAGTRRS